MLSLAACLALAAAAADTTPPGGDTTSTPAAVDSPTCYPNCDRSTIQPCLNVNDFVCFLNAYAMGNPYANCDASSALPVLNVNDFICFLNGFSSGCGPGGPGGISSCLPPPFPSFP